MSESSTALFEDFIKVQEFKKNSGKGQSGSSDVRLDVRSHQDSSGNLSERSCWQLDVVVDPLVSDVILWDIII